MPDPIDLTLLRGFAGGNNALEKELVGVFITQSDITLKILQENCLSGHNTPWVEAAHMFKGGAVCAGANALSQLCAQAQQMPDVTADARRVIFSQIDREYGAVKAYLRENGLY